MDSSTSSLTPTEQRIPRKSFGTRPWWYIFHSIATPPTIKGPLRINGSLVANSTFVSGRVGQALEIKNVNRSTFELHGLVLLGVSSRSHSFSVWIRPYVQQKSTIIHVSGQTNGTGWCLPILGLTSTRQLMSYTYNGTVFALMGSDCSAEQLDSCSADVQSSEWTAPVRQRYSQ